ncbi:Ger(x)C family spore germination protein [Cohnella herbarum]|uniref:Ger(X)C family spore germination protein n=1 Tax=Cohnella herbarum TaxID=2728023 RepID=A0A7Z2VHT7_9BACL|nr:Ger(x)C family spore germination protein [Cohnella herbarum]QJD83144.1 Ger(x)C family spore germination protein [Cohnella herbarum]
MKRLLLLGSALIFLFPLTGCWNSKDIQNMDYVTAIGLDFVDGKYITYVQVLNFTNIGRSETLEVGKSVPIWVGKGEGSTISESLSSIYATSQMRIFWGHVKTIVCTENVLKRGVRDAYNAMNRFGDVRYNILIFGTKEKLSDIFIQKSIFNLSPLDTLMFSPEQIYAQRSFIVPKTGNQVIAQINEPGEPGMLPSLTINKGTWREDKNSKSLLKINGAYFFNQDKMAAWLSEDELAGTRWSQKELKRSLIRIPAEGKAIATMVMINPHYKVDIDVVDGKVWYDVSLKIDATLDELMKDVSIDYLEQQASEVISDEIRESFHNGLKKQVDVLMLEETLYRNRPKEWHRLHKSQAFLLDHECLRKIIVKVDLRNTGKYKGRTK